MTLIARCAAFLRIGLRLDHSNEFLRLSQKIVCRDTIGEIDVKSFPQLIKHRFMSSPWVRRFCNQASRNVNEKFFEHRKPYGHFFQFFVRQRQGDSPDVTASEVYGAYRRWRASADTRQRNVTCFGRGRKEVI